MSPDNSEEKENKSIRSSTTFWSGALFSYITLVTGTWGFVEAYTYFQSDRLKNAIGPYWVGIYLVPIPIALIIGIIRSRNQSSHKVSNRPEQKDRSTSHVQTGQYLKYKGLLWKPARFRFQLPTALCSRDNCGRPIRHERKYPPQYLVSSNLDEMQEFLNKQNSYRNVYHCPFHGELSEVPDIELENLRQEAQFELKR